MIVTADHGEALGEDDYWFAHGHSVALDQIRVPLVWRPPPRLGSRAADRRGRVESRPVSTLDIAPTLLSSAGLPLPADFEGIPFDALDTAHGRGPSERRIFSEHPLRAAVVADGIYYARDRQPIAAPVPDPLRGGALHAMVPRFAELAEDGAQRPYRPAEWVALDAPDPAARPSEGTAAGAADSNEAGSAIERETIELQTMDEASRSVLLLEAELARFQERQ